MDKVETISKYDANDADALVGELFSGKTSIGDAIEKLRTRLLDLSARNRLLNYRHPKGKCVQICDVPGIDLVFDRLYADGRSVPLKPVPEPHPTTYEGKRPEAKAYAARIGISTSFELPIDVAGSLHRRLHGLQTHLYPAELERQARKTAGEAKTAIEETGTNVLFLVFGFLEFYDSEDSERALVAPLISLPVSLSRGGINIETRTYEYTVSHNGEDLAENHTLREKLRRDFTLELPDFEEDDKPESYFSRIENAIRNKRRWRVRRQITISMLSFGKLAIWVDLDTRKNPGLLQHPLLKSIFSGSTTDAGAGFYADDYEIDNRKEAEQHLIYNADSSQHSAIIDVLAGKNLVINGPPGTGKSQTITNVIASALAQGKKVLFVSEKLAALEVVRHRLNHAGLGHFCLELHSHKTQKKKFIEDLEARLAERFPAPAQYKAKLATLQRQKAELARYAELMGTRVGNDLGLTINEVFWAVERRRQEIGEISVVVNAITLPEARRWTPDDIKSRATKLSALAELYNAIGYFDALHPWWGFRPKPLVPTDDEAIGGIIHAALVDAEKADAAANEAVAFFDLKGQPDADTAAKVRRLLDRIPPLPDAADPAILLRMFDQESDPKGQQSAHLLAEVVTSVTKARTLFDSASKILAGGDRIPVHEMNEIEKHFRESLSNEVLTTAIDGAIGRVIRLECATERFQKAANESRAPYGLLAKPTVHAFIEQANRIAPLDLTSFPVSKLTAVVTAIKAVERQLSTALNHISNIATRRAIPFNATPVALAELASPSCLVGLRTNLPINEHDLFKARQLMAFPLADKPLAELARIRSRLVEEMRLATDALSTCRDAVECLAIPFEATEHGVQEAIALAKVATAAPPDLMEYRKSTFGHARTLELIETARQAIQAERNTSDQLSLLFYLDDLPAITELKPAMVVLRSKDGLLAFFDREWRNARKLHLRMAKEKKKASAKERANELAKLISWLEAKEAFVTNPEYKQYCGDLFRGLDTNINALSILNSWYCSARAHMAECAGMIEKVDLTLLPAPRIAELATKASTVITHAKHLDELENTVQSLIGTDFTMLREAKAKGWAAIFECLENAIAGCDTVLAFFLPRVADNLSPRDALRLMETRSELDAAQADLSLLIGGQKALREAAGDEAAMLVETNGADWKSALTSIRNTIELIDETARQSSKFASPAATLATAVSFASAKLEFDEAWQTLSCPKRWDQFSDWASLNDAATAVAKPTHAMLARLAPGTLPGKSPDAVFHAYTAESEAQGILNRIEESNSMQRLLGNVFEGKNTNLDRLAQTHMWGDAVCAIDLPPALRKAILSPHASEILAKARTLYLEIEAGTNAGCNGIKGLEKFGSFLWAEWQKQVRKTAEIDMPSEIVQRMKTALAHLEAVLPWSKYIQLRQQLRQEGLADFVTAIETGKIPPEYLAAAFELSAYQSIGRGIYQGFPELTHFNGPTHGKTRSDYGVLDAEIVAITGQDFANRIDRCKEVPDGQRGVVVGDYTEMHLLRREINKTRRHIPIRQLVKRAGRALQELKPCFMMGPLSVAQYLEQGSLQFDLVVMDEASQLRPEEALGAIARGSQLVVVGDPKQLPPSNFFDRMLDSADDEDEDSTPAATSGMESILDICQQLFTPVRSLRWHYRSHHESLIAFSNHHFYKNLIVFPSPYAKNPGLGVKYFLRPCGQKIS